MRNGNGIVEESIPEGSATEETAALEQGDKTVFT